MKPTIETGNGSASATFTRAIVRKPGANFAQGLTSVDLGEPSYPLMLHQHGAYIDALESLGLEVIVLDALPGYPDAHFVEDVAVVTAEVAVITHPGALPRRGEIRAMEPVLAAYRPTTRIEAPGTVDGGDVLIVGSHAFVGLSERTNPEGFRQLAHILERHGYTCDAIPVGEGLHLKSSVNAVGGGMLLVTERFANHEALRRYEQIIVEADEEYAANTLLINGCLLTPKGFPKTRRRLEDTGRKILELDVSEARKMDGGLTCLSLRF